MLCLSAIMLTNLRATRRAKSSHQGERFFCFFMVCGVVGEALSLPPINQNKIERKALIGFSNVSPRDTNTPRIKPVPAVANTTMLSVGIVAMMFIVLCFKGYEFKDKLLNNKSQIYFVKGLLMLLRRWEKTYLPPSRNW